jgi:carbonic anhydrase
MDEAPQTVPIRRLIEEGCHVTGEHTERRATPIEPASSESAQEPGALSRRAFLGIAIAGTLASDAAASAQWTGSSGNLSREQRDRMTPREVLDALKEGNERFRTGKTIARDYRAQQRATAAGQFPAAAVLGCVDSRVPAEIVFDAGIGDLFSARIAGNVVNDDLLGSLEFACALAGAKVVLLLGHTGCGAIKGAINNVELGNLTGLLARIKPAIAATPFDDEGSSKSAAYVDAVARTNVRLGIRNIREHSPILADLEKKGTIQIAGAMYDLASGMVDFIPSP